MKKVSFTKNSFGIKVAKCCGSCAHKCFKGANNLRWCDKKNKKVEAFNVCKAWTMSKGMQLAGGSEGQVKRGVYLKFVHRLRMSEQTAIEKGEMKVCDQKPVAIVRAEFENYFGISPFMGK